MTDKQERILQAALERFANAGYDATSTSQIAKLAGVSEGLIFRHFDNKQGLLNAILQDAERRISAVLSHVIFETDPRQVIRKTLEIPFSIDEADYDFWRLQFKLKWESSYYQPTKMQPLADKLTWAFTQLGYANPAAEAWLLEQLLDAISTNILRQGKAPQLPYLAFLHEKYQLG